MVTLGRRRLLMPAITALLLAVITLFYLTLPAKQQHALPHPVGHDSYSPSDTPIPKQIWQIFFPPPGAPIVKPSTFFSAEWISLSPGYKYTLISDTSATDLIGESFRHRPEIATTYQALRNPALKSDLLRYLILSARGGIYSDIDTKPLIPPDLWLPASLRTTTKAIVAVEYDRYGRDGYSADTIYPVQICQWTLAATPGHPLFERMVDRSLSNLRAVARAQNVAYLADAVFSDWDVLNSTGPVAWSEVVLDLLRERDGSLTELNDLSAMREPRVFGDVVVLPVWSFRGDWRDDWGTWLDWRAGRRALVRHFYRGGWRIAKGWRGADLPADE